MAHMKDPEVTAIERAIVDDPKIEDSLRILLKLVKISRQRHGGPEGSDFIPDGSRLAEGFPLADTRLLPHDMGELRERFSRLVGVMLEKDPKGTDEIIRFYGDEGVFRSLLSGVLTQEYQFPGAFTGSRHVTLLAANETLLPSIIDVRQEAERRDLFGEWAASYCPVCGAPAHLSLIEGDEGRLFLSCSRCLTRWKFHRMMCAFCGESKQRNLRYFTAEGDIVHRVYVCETCKHYLKSVDLGEKATVFPRLEDLVTIRLDLVAKREGYIRDTVDLVSILAMGE
jgi:FdhE protein